MTSQVWAADGIPAAWQCSASFNLGVRVLALHLAAAPAHTLLMCTVLLHTFEVEFVQGLMAAGCGDINRMRTGLSCNSSELKVQQMML